MSEEPVFPTPPMPPSYSEATAVQDSLSGRELSFVDFIPQCLIPGKLFRTPTFEPFRNLVSRANDWLTHNPSWEVRTCESVEFTTILAKTEPEKMIYHKSSKDMHMAFIRGLRLWLGPRMNPSRPPQQIAYCNLVPHQLEPGGLFSPIIFESLDQVLTRYNAECRARPPPGKVLTIETQEIKLTTISDFDPDKSYWVEGGSLSQHFLLLLRIFYEVQREGSVSLEDIGLADFVPEGSRLSGLFSSPQFEPYTSVVNKASMWFSQQSTLRFCNAQSVKIKPVAGWQDIDTRKMYYTQSSEMTTWFVWTVRICYTTSGQINTDPEKATIVSPLLSYPLSFTCKTFTPAQLVKGFTTPQFENLSQTMSRINAWLNATGARALSSETVAIPLAYDRGSAENSEVDTNLTINNNMMGYRILVIRVFLDGTYQEPPSYLLPQVPIVQDVDCCCSVQ